ncbi:MAG TPA: UvrD-helicase domain-containing protein [Candidatus Binatia bacterium]|nr:UvrD-helicase domain-containing protein [Candidatus Binatia bacterium]
MQPYYPAPDDLTRTQAAAIEAEGSSFLRGQAGTGKTTALLYRLLRLLQQRESAYGILILVAEADDRRRILDFLERRDVEEPRDLRITTFTYLAREMVQQFWPLVARPAGFERPFQAPIYIHYDMAQLLMWRVVRAMMAGGAFADLVMRPQQIVSQILDTLNRAALNRLSLQEAEQRQLQSWAGEPAETRHLRDAAGAAQAFRAHCRRNSLLDVSLTVRVFDTQLLQHPEFNRYFHERFRHILVDNVEEQTPAGQQFVSTLLDTLQSAAIVYDEGGGYKQLLSADPAGARQLEALCRQTFAFERQFVSSTPLVHLANAVERHLLPTTKPQSGATEVAGEAVLDVVHGRYRHEMAQNVVRQLAKLLGERRIEADDAAIIAPGLDGALRHTLAASLREAGLPFSLLRRRSSPRDEPVVRAWLTLLALAHPEWQRPPGAYDVAEALSLSIAGLDPARAELLTNDLYLPAEGALGPVAALSPELAQRIGAAQVGAMEELRQWLQAHNHLSLEDFLLQLQAALQAEPGFLAGEGHGADELAQWLVGLGARLGEAAPAMGLETVDERGRAFLNAIDEGLVTTDPPEVGEPPEPRGVVVTTIHGYLLSEETSRVQVWFDVSNPTWWDIPQQTLSNPFILRPEWPADRVWTLAEGYRQRNEMLSQIVRGLAVRCHDGVVLGVSTLDQRGRRQDSPLWRALRQITRSSS